MDLNEDEYVQETEELNADNSGQEEDEEEEGEGEEFIDVLDVLDGRGEIDIESDAEDLPRPTMEEGGKRSLETGNDGHREDVGEGNWPARGENTDSDDSMEDPSANDKLAFTFSDTEDAAPEALDELQSFISSLSPLSKKRKASDGADSSSNALVERSRKQRRLFLKERTEAGAENEFRAEQSGTSLQFFSVATLI